MVGAGIKSSFRCKQIQSFFLPMPKVGGAVYTPLLTVICYCERPYSLHMNFKETTKMFLCSSVDILQKCIDFFSMLTIGL